MCPISNCLAPRSPRDLAESYVVVLADPLTEGTYAPGVDREYRTPAPFFLNLGNWGFRPRRYMESAVIPRDPGRDGLPRSRPGRILILGAGESGKDVPCR